MNKVKIVLDAIIKILTAIINVKGAAKRRENQRKAMDEEIIKYREEYQKAIKEGNAKQIIYYRNLIDRRMRNL